MKKRKCARRAGGLLLAFVPAIAPIGCASHEHRAVVAAREAYAQCVAEHSETHPDCEVLRQQHLTVQRRYEENSRRAWDCDPLQEECPTSR